MRMQPSLRAHSRRVPGKSFNETARDFSAGGGKSRRRVTRRAESLLTSGAEATVECDPSGLSSAARNDVSCYATILQRAPLIAQPVPGTIKSFAVLSAENYRGPDERERERRNSFRIFISRKYPRRGTSYIFPTTEAACFPYRAIMNFISDFGKSQCLAHRSFSFILASKRPHT